jgi:PAP2 superfamily
MWLSPESALLITPVLAGFGVVGRSRFRRSSEASRETAIVTFLYALWRLFNVVEVRIEGGQRRGLQIWHLERALGLGSERWLQARLLGQPRVLQAANVYYAVMHAPAMVACLIWLFLRHRNLYAHWRSVLALSTGADVLIRLVPVAPPRLLPDLGFIDTGRLYHQSVYGRFGGGVSDQLAAMPSIHAGWAVLIAVAVFASTRSRWRWLGVAHAVLTMLSVVVTANHWWLDCIVAAAMLVPISLGWTLVSQAVAARRAALKQA